MTEATPRSKPPRSPLWELVHARLRELYREPGILFWVFGFPILLAVALGIAFRERGPERLKIGVVADTAELAESTARALQSAPDLDVVRLPSGEHAQAALGKAKVDLVVEVSTRTASAATFRYDPLQPKSRYARLAADAALEAARGRKDVLTGVDAHTTERGQRYVDYLVPGLIGTNLMGSSLWGIGFAIVDARSRRLMKRFAATPMPRAYYLASFIISRLILLAAEMAVLLLFAVLAFDVRPAGSLFALTVTGTLGALSFAGIALVIAARTAKTEIASGWMNFAMLPMWILSGTFFSYDRFPVALHGAIRALPLTALNDALRAIMNDGAGLDTLVRELITLAAWGLVGFAIALRRFRWT